MHVSVNQGNAIIIGPDGVIHNVPYEPLSDADMVLQARYHQWLHRQDYRRTLICQRCKEPMEADTALNEEQGTWELLTVCSCRALYGKVALSKLPSPTES